VIIVLASGALGYAIGKLTGPSSPGTIPDGGTAVTYKVKPVIKLERVTTALLTYTEVCKWNLTQYQGFLDEISITCDNFAKMKFNLDIGTLINLHDKSIQDILDLEFDDQLIEPNTEIKISVASIDGTAIVVDGMIVGRELMK
jgi:hypothetical protein